VFSSEDAVTLQPGETKTEQFLTSDIVGYHTAPSVTMDAGVSVVSYSYRCWGMEITFKNNNSVASNISSVAFDAKPLLASNGRAVSVSDQLSIRLNGRQKFSMDHELIQDVNTASTIANSLLSSYKDARNDAVVDSRGNIALRLGDRVQIPGRNDELSDYSVIRQDIYWEGYLKATVEAQKI
jgi:hypothetical protein